MGTPGLHQNSPAFDTKLTPSHIIDYISLPLVMNKLIPDTSRAITSPRKMSLLLEVERTPAVIIKPRPILVTHTDHPSRNKTID